MSKDKFIPNQLGLFAPTSSWQPPSELPDLRNRALVALDTETHDRGLEKNLGPGWAIGLTELAGISYAAEGVSGYIPLRHPDTTCFDLNSTMRWLNDLALSDARLVFHNAGYDISIMGNKLGHPLPLRDDQLEDTLAASVMLDEDMPIYKQGATPYSLDNCCAAQGVPGKDLDLLVEAVRAYGGNPAKPSASLHLLPARYAGPYAEADAVATLALWHQLEGQLHAQGVWRAYKTETNLIPMIVAMRRRGIRIDTGLAQRTAAGFRATRDRHLAEMGRLLGRRPLAIDELRSPRTMEALFTSESISFPRTPKTNRGSFSSDWMAEHSHWLPRMVVDALKFEDAASKFIDSYLLSFAHKGRLHAEIHQFRSDDGGTRSHRFSYSSPPLQQMSSPDKDPRDEAGALIVDRAVGTPIRKCFLPEEGELWAAPDFSSQEPRFTVHFAATCKCTGVQPMVDAYNADPRMSYHAEVGRWLKQPKSRAKILNLAMTYGRGKAALAEELGLSVMEAEAVLTEYHERLPYIKPLENACKQAAGSRGYLRLIDGARVHFNTYEAAGWIDWDVKSAAIRAGKIMLPTTLEKARERAADPEHPWHNKRLVRADTRKALNRLVQASAARQTKIAMLQMWRDGTTPLIQMHDEICVSVSSEAQVQRLEQIMVDAVKLCVPVVVDAEVGPSWGEAKLSWAEAERRYLTPHS